jgi:Tfp pilus assembly protein FimT
MKVQNQRGITLMGFLVVLAVVSFFFIIGAKLFPAYSEFNSVKSCMNEMALESGAANFTKTTAWNSMERRFNISYVETPKQNCLTLEKKNGANLTCTYEYRTGFIYNIDFVVKFAHTVRMGGPAA